MEFPFGHHHHHHHRDEDEERPRYPPPGHQPYGHDHPEPAYPPPHFDRPVQHVGHEVGDRAYDPPGPYPYPPPANQSYTYGRPEPAYPPPPHFEPPVQHVAHHSGHHHGRPPPPVPAPVHHVSHESPLDAALNRLPTVRIFTRAEENYSLSIRDGKVVLARANPRDEHQHWIKDLKYSTKVKDEEGFPAFALVNKATGEALKHSIGATHPVRMIRYNPDYLDESVLWTESKDVGHGFRCIRMVNNIRLNFDAFHGDEDHGGVHDGTILVLWEWLKGKNQSWKIVPY